ncbi:MAG TPA: hypothetical protein VL282_12180 [Tepidisphaeraceae bacterium]|jgi:hypothetical protein|nr:hypothetical protein [Tepidisphaeraceae bacterium]
MQERSFALEPLEARLFRSAETARSADAFVDSFGVNTHFRNGDPYANPQILAKLNDLGFRHIRDNADQTSVGGFTTIDTLNTLYGIKTDFILGDTFSTPSQLATILHDHPAIEAIEGLNEPDAFGPRSYNGFTDNWTTNDYSATKAYQNDIYSAVKNSSDPRVQAIPVLSPAMANTTKAQYLAGINFDYEAMHSYPGSTHNPVPGLDTRITRTNQMAGTGPTKPIMATETGYFTANLAGGVSEAAAGKLMPRLFAEFYNHGIVRTYSYELADEGTNSADREQDFGLLHYDLTPKPAYTAMKNLVTLIEEPGATFTPSSLDYTLSGSTTDVDHLLLQKSDGRFYLLLWHEVQVYDGADVPNPDVSVTITFGSEMDRVRTYLPNDSITPTATLLDHTSANLSVPDQMMVVEITPTLPEPATMAGLALTAYGLLTRPRRPSKRRTTDGCVVESSHLAAGLAPRENR